MKLATLKNGTRDGRLVIVSKDLTRAIEAAPIASTLQAALDNWAQAAPQLEALSQQVELGSVPTFRFHETACESPLPRAYQWADGSAYLNHVSLVRQARGDTVPESFYTDPLLYQGGSDGFLGPRDPIPLADPAWGCDMEGEIAVITDDVPMGVSESEAAGHIKLIMLCNDISLRNLIPAELAKGFGFFQSKPPSAFSPIALTTDELGPAWRDTLVHLPLRVTLNGQPFGHVEAGEGASFSLARLISHAARTRPLCAGTIIGSGTVSNPGPDGGPGKTVAQGGRGYACIAEQRMVETILHGAPTPPFLQIGDQIRLEMLDAHGHSLFGAIEQSVAGV